MIEKNNIQLHRKDFGRSTKVNKRTIITTIITKTLIIYNNSLIVYLNKNFYLIQIDIIPNNYRGSWIQHRVLKYSLRYEKLFATNWSSKINSVHIWNICILSTTEKLAYYVDSRYKTGLLFKKKKWKAIKVR